MPAGFEIQFVDAATIRARLRPRDAVEALASAFVNGLDPSSVVSRSRVPLASGEFLLMPAEMRGAVGIKVVTVAPGNAERGLARIQGLYLLFEHETLSPVAVFDGAELTALRTPAVSLLGVRNRLFSCSGPLQVVVIGAGIQALRHAEATADVMQEHDVSIALTLLTRGEKLVDVPTSTAEDVQLVPIDSDDADKALAQADLVVCATTATTPLFDGRLIRDDAAVVAIGSHTPGDRELDEGLLARSSVVVEDVSTAMREAGDVIQAVRAGALNVQSLVPLSRVVADPTSIAGDRPLVLKTTGMAWQDLVIATAVWRRG